MTDIQHLRNTIEPDSTQLNGDDFMAGPETVTVTALKAGPSEQQPINVHLAEYDRPWRPSKSMRRVMIAIWGERGSDWVGKSLTLYFDRSVKFGGVAVGGIRISHMSGLDGARTLMLTTTRAKRSGYTVQPLVDAPAPSDGKTYDDLMRDLANSPGEEAFSSMKVDAKRIYRSLTKQQQQQLTAAIKAVEAELSE